MNFRKTLKRPLTPHPRVLENYDAFFSRGSKICNKIFRIKGRIIPGLTAVFLPI